MCKTPCSQQGLDEVDREAFFKVKNAYYQANDRPVSKNQYRKPSRRHNSFPSQDFLWHWLCHHALPGVPVCCPERLAMTLWPSLATALTCLMFWAPLACTQVPLIEPVMEIVREGVARGLPMAVASGGTRHHVSHSCQQCSALGGGPRG
jgi:hypothetical protein